jgi:hypothetical protein
MRSILAENSLQTPSPVFATCVPTIGKLEIFSGEECYPIQCDAM